MHFVFLTKTDSSGLHRLSETALFLQDGAQVGGRPGGNAVLSSEPLQRSSAARCWGCWEESLGDRLCPFQVNIGDTFAFVGSSPRTFLELRSVLTILSFFFPGMNCFCVSVVLEANLM